MSRVVFRPLWTTLTVICLTVCGLTAIGLTAGDSATPARPARAAVVAASSPGTGASDPPFRSVRSYPEVAEPVRLRIPAQRISTSLQRLGLAADGTIAAPTQWQVAGWYARGPRPGQQGPAVIVGHIDSKTGPAVFYRLPALKPGDVVYVDRDDGSTARFRVTGHRQVAKARFPAKTVYSPTLQSSLLLITCGGTFDRSTGHYRDNLIVTAVPG